MQKIAIIGGLGYLGLHLVDYLKDRDFEITVFARKNIPVFADDNAGYSVCDMSEDFANRQFDVVINLAYPTGYSIKNNFSINWDIASYIKKISGTRTRIIHASTLAVFGIGLDQPIKRGAIKMRRDASYPEVKLYMEKLLEQEFRNYDLHIIRLGNISGPGAASWLKGIADRLVFREPFPESAQTAPSNITHVTNACDFIRYLIEGHSTERLIHYHHLAEFYNITWGEILKSFGNILGEQPEYRPFANRNPGTVRDELRMAFSQVKPSAVFYKMLELRVLSSYARNVVDLIPARRRLAIKTFPDHRILASGTMDIVFSNQVPFPMDTGTGWVPPFTFEDYLKSSSEYMSEAGYILKP